MRIFSRTFRTTMLRRCSQNGACVHAATRDVGDSTPTPHNATHSSMHTPSTLQCLAAYMLSYSCPLPISRTHAHAQEAPHYSVKNCSVGSQAARHGRHNALRWRLSEAPERDGPGAFHRHRPQGRRAEDLPAFDIPVRCFFVFTSSFPSSHVGMPGKTVSTAPLAAPTVPHELTRASSVSVCVL